MGAAQQLVDNKILRGLVPLDGLSPHNFNEVVSRLQIKQIEKGGSIFKEGDRDLNTIYLIQGKVELQQSGKKVSTIHAGSHDAAHPLAPKQPRPISAKAKTRVTIAVIDKTLLDVYTGGTHQENAYEVRDINTSSDDDDWMTRLLQSDAFLRLPPMNIQRMLTRMQSVPLKAFETVIKEGDEGDAYYAIKRGRCRVSRYADDNTETKLAEISDGACFGEEALLSDSKRSATVTMMTDGELMRLSKKDFLELLNDPLVNHVAYTEAATLIKQGAKWLDTRNSVEHSAQCIIDSINIPMRELRDKLEFLDKNTTYITYCNDGRTSSAATFVLGQHGINSRALNNGMASVDTSLITVLGNTQHNSEPVESDIESDSSLITDNSATARDEPASAEIIEFEEPLGAKHIAQIKQLRLELDNLRKLSETRLKHTKLQSYEQLEKLQSELKTSQNRQSDSRTHNQDEIKRLKAALYEEQENAAAISTSKLETENALTKLLEQINALKQQDAQRQAELKTAQKNVTELEQAGLSANNTVSELQSKLELAKQDKDESKSTLQQQIDSLNSELSEATHARDNLDSALKTAQERIERLIQNEQQSIQQAEEYQQEISHLNEALNEAVDSRKQIEEELYTTKESIDALTQDEKQAAEQVKDHLQEIDHLKNKLDQAITAQRQADQEVSILRGKLEGSKEAQQEVVSKLKLQLENASTEQQEISNEREALHTQLSVAEQQLSEKQNAINELASNSDETQSAIESLNRDYESVLSEKNQLNEKIESITSELNEASSKNEVRIKELATSVEDGHRTNQSLEQDNRELKLKLEDAARETERLQVSISGEIDAEIERLLSEVKDKSSTLTQLQGAFDNSTQHAQDLEKKLTGLENQLEEVQSSSQQRISELDISLQESQDAHNAAENSAKEHLKTLAQLDNQLSTKERELEQSRAHLISLESKTNADQGIQNDLESKVQGFERTQESLQEKISDYEAQISALHHVQGNSDELAQRLALLNTENETLRSDLSTIEGQLHTVSEQLENTKLESTSANEELVKIKVSAYDLEAKTTELSTDNNDLRSKLSATEDLLANTREELNHLQSNSGSSNEEVSAIKETILSLETSKIALEEKLTAQESLETDNLKLKQRITELEQSKQALVENIESNESNQNETTQNIKQFEQEKLILIEKIGNSEELINSLRNDLESANNNTEELTKKFEQINSTYEQQIADLKDRLDTQIRDHQKTNSTLEDLHTSLRTERLDLETQLHEQRLLREQADTVANATKLEIEGMRAELESANQQLHSANNNTSSSTNTEQLQRLSSDLAKAVEYRKQSEMAKQALQDDINEIRKEVARLKGENDGHLELRIQLEGQLAVLRQSLSYNPAANEIIDNIKNLTDGNGLGSIPAITDIGQTSWESKPSRNRNYFMIVAIMLAIMLIGASSWLFKSQLGLEDEWQSILGKTKNTTASDNQSVPKKATTSSNTDASDGKTPNNQPAQTSAKGVTPAPTVKKSPAAPSLAVTPTSRNVTPIPFRVYRNALKDGGASPVMVEMPAGNFTMGSSVTSDFFEERPHRDVKVNRFAISKHEVNFAEYRKFTKATKRPIPEDEGWGREDQPVINVSWQDAVNYAAWLSEQTGHSYRLPSESEWEYMARAGTQATYWWGNEPRGEYANCSGCSGKLAGKQSLPVESYEANAFGIKNTAGNVAEWVQDCYHSSYENAPLDSKAWITNGSCDKRMVRGGSYRSPLSQLRSSTRDSFDITTRSDAIGFRIVREY